MKKVVIVLLVLLVMVACKKDTVQSIGYSSCRLEGMPVQSKSIWVKYTYLSNKFNRAELYFGYTDYSIGDSLHNFNQALGSAGTDSLIAKATYHSNKGTFYFWSSIPQATLLSPVTDFYMQTIITNVSGNTISGSFMGALKGISSSTGLMQTDSITVGVFTDVPIIRVYQ